MATLEPEAFVIRVANELSIKYSTLTEFEALSIAAQIQQSQYLSVMLESISDHIGSLDSAIRSLKS